MVMEIAPLKNDLAGEKTASGVFFENAPVSRLVCQPQVAETYQEDVTFFWKSHQGSLLSQSVQEQNTGGGRKPVFNAKDVAAVLSATEEGRKVLAQLQGAGVRVITADVYIPVFDKNGQIVRDADGKVVLGPASTALGGYISGSKDPAIIVINNFGASTGTFKGTDAQLYAGTLIHELEEYSLAKQGFTGSYAAKEIQARANTETILQKMGIPELLPGYRTPAGAPNMDAITRDVNNNPAYSGDQRRILQNRSTVLW